MKYPFINQYSLQLNKKYLMNLVWTSVWSEIFANK